MNIARSVTLNFSALMAAQVVTFALAFILRVFLGRYLGDVGMGKLAFALSLAAIVTVFAGLGQGPYLTKEMARDRTAIGILITNAALVRAVLLFVFLLIIFFTVPVLPQDEETKTLLILVLISFAISSFNSVIISSVFRAFDRMALTSVGLVLEKVILTAACVFLLLNGADIVMVGFIYVAGAVGNLLVSIVLLLRMTRPKLSLRPDLLKSIFSGGLPFFVFAMFGTIYQRIDATMLSFMTHDAVVGWYSVAFGLYETLAFLPSTFQLILFPILARLHVTSKESFNQLTSRTFDLFSVITMPISLGSLILAPQIIEFLFPLESFANSIILFQILSTSMILLFYNILFGTTLMAMDKQKHWSMAAVAAAIVNPTLNYFLIPFFQNLNGNGAIGAALATESIELMMICVGFILLPKGIIKRRNFFFALRTLLAASIMAGIVWTLRGNNLFVLVGLGAVIYLLASVILKTITREDAGLLWLAIRKRDHSPAHQSDSEIGDKASAVLTSD